MKKKIVFDVSVLVTGYVSGNIFKTGIYRVSYELLFRLNKLNDYKIYLCDIYGRERELRKYIAPFFEQEQVLRVDSKLYKLFGYPFFNLADLYREKEQKANKSGTKFINKFFKNSFYTIGRCFQFIEKKRGVSSKSVNLGINDIYISTYNKFPRKDSFLSPLRKVIIVHDLIPIIHPEYFYDIENKKIMEDIINSISDDDHVICVSESTKMDFLQYRSSFNLKKVSVAPLAGATFFKPVLSIEQILAVKNKYKIPNHKSYFLSVCTIEPRKNIGMLIDAYERLIKQVQVKDIPVLVLTGVVGWKAQPILDKINRINSFYPDCIVLTGFVTDEELTVFYSNTLAFVYPSFYEGFGLPPLEAMQCGAPVITSNNSSLPEVVDNAGILIDARDEDDLLQGLISCLDNKKVLAMRQKSLQRASLFSWDKTVDNIVKVIQQL